MIAIASDHAGYQLKQAILVKLDKQGIAYQDFGAFDTKDSDYPDYASKVAHAVASGDYEKGILVCGTGLGMSIAANKVRGIRAAVCTDEFSARASRMHNDANILCLGERVTGQSLALSILDAWLATDFAGDRHACRVGKITQIEDENQR